MLLSTAYFPPVEYFALLAKDFTLSPDRVIPSMVHIEACENYQKQSYRTRCRIAAAGGVEELSVPIVHGPDRLITSIRVDYSVPWVLQTCRAIDSAYYSSPYFEYYRDELFELLGRRTETLFELNLSLTRFFLDKTGIACRLLPTTTFVREGSAADDFRYVIHPKRSNTILRDLSLERPYYQVFSGKYGFTGGLSVMDLLFNEGPDSILWLKNLQDNQGRNQI